jgi:DNA invertase Pin-like site-specific DNA recombinase
MKKTKAFSYLRVSGIGQIDGDGFTRQRETIENFARKNKFDIVNEFRDEGVSGTKDCFDREGLTELFVALKANGVRTVIVERPDRLARKLVVSEIILSEFRKIGVTVLSAESGTDLAAEEEDSERTLIRQILMAVAQWEKSVIVQKLRASRVRIRKTQGRCEGRKPYGATEEERQTLARMNQWRAEKQTFATIAARLNADGIKPRSGAKWHVTSIRRILTR